MVQPDRRSLTLFLLFALCAPALTQTIAISDHDVNIVRPNIGITTDESKISPLHSGTEHQSPPQPLPTSDDSAQKPYGWHIAVYPVLAWAVVFGSGVTLPPTPSQPIHEPGPSGNTNGGLNGAYFGGARLERGKWSADLLFMWAGLSAQRDKPFTKVDMDFVFGDVFGGREVLPGLYVEGGARRVALDIHATVGSNTAYRSPGFWDPLVGVTYRRELGKKWRILIHGDGGGFGAGSNVDVTATGRAEWQFARHFGITMGYGGIHLSESNTVAGRTLEISPTLHGPIFGFGIYF